MNTLVKEMHLPNASTPINVTDDGITISFKDLQSKKALSSIRVTEDGISILVNDKQ